jgi:hypothetical protein
VAGRVSKAISSVALIRPALPGSCPMKIRTAMAAVRPAVAIYENNLKDFALICVFLLAGFFLKKL